MFHLFGRKKSIIKHYPEPIYDTIIEPFAGAASYALHYYNTKNVILFEKDIIIYSIWSHIINEATQESILKLPILKLGDNIDSNKFNYLKPAEKYLIGFFMRTAVTRPAKSMSKTKNFNKWSGKTRLQLSNDIYKVKHWNIYNMSYENIPINIKATWFIDPPYQGYGGQFYIHSNKDIDYNNLRKWVKTRKGQVIVCENEDATWLPFKPLIAIWQSGKLHKEMIYIRN